MVFIVDSIKFICCCLKIHVRYRVLLNNVLNNPNNKLLKWLELDNLSFSNLRCRNTR